MKFLAMMVLDCREMCNTIRVSAAADVQHCLQAFRIHRKTWLLPCAFVHWYEEKENCGDASGGPVYTFAFQEDQPRVEAIPTNHISKPAE
jgi:hypothetical protein